MPKTDSTPHGTKVGYSYHGCRCERCTEANTRAHRMTAFGRRYRDLTLTTPQLTRLTNALTAAISDRLPDADMLRDLIISELEASLREQLPDIEYSSNMRLPSGAVYQEAMPPALW
ncbi:hypothetical protein F8O07_06640 [Pseudoclavibacter sp. CFCC 13796]|uniref:hypothetical protein n=1 Tax=Pseudoclavibacter sp. CFCC 13796 TaxID=2615179 RepID=UPI001300F98E|nr:hypothetical protein [Pseudoclavibacter sp. CFCC 13796]KAB1661576.1 hypothetical protein F8O07_06640 [Pseudoclavibacter sp. CFCC 13796]